MGYILRTMTKLLTHTDLPISSITGVWSKLLMYFAIIDVRFYYHILSYSLASFFINIWLYSCLIL